MIIGKDQILMRNMRFLIFLLLGLCITPATSRPSQTDDDEGQVRETEYEAGDDAKEYLQDEKESLESDNKRIYDDMAEETNDYDEPDSEDPAVKNNRQFLDDQKIGNRDVLEDDHNVEIVKEEAISHDRTSNTNKRTSDTEENEPTPDVTLKDKLYKNSRDQNGDKFDVKEEAIRKNKESLIQMNEYAGKVSNEKLENLNDRNHDETDPSSSAVKVSKKRSNKRDTIGTFDTSDYIHKRNNKNLSKKDLEDLLSSLSIEKVNILKMLINDNENVAKRDIAKKANAVDGDKSTDDSRINVRENQEKCHSSIPSTCESESPHHIHSLNTYPPSGCEIKIPNPSDMCNLTTPRAELSDTDTNQDKTQSKEIKFMDDTLTDIRDMKNENNKQSDESDLENIANLKSFYDFSEHRNNYRDNENDNSDNYPEFGKFDSKLLKRDTSRTKHADALMEQLEDSFSKGYGKFNSDSDLEPLVRVKRTEGEIYSTDSKQTCQNKKLGGIDNFDFATDKMSIGSDTDNILSNNEEVDSTLMYDKSRSKRARDKTLGSEFYNTYGTNLEHDRILGDTDKLALVSKETGSQDAVVDGLENMTELKDVNRYKRIRQANEETHTRN